MRKYDVTGTSEVVVHVLVKADNVKDAIKKATEKFEGIHAYLGNGGADKIIGVNGSGESIYADNNVKFDDAMEVD